MLAFGMLNWDLVRRGASASAGAGMATWFNFGHHAVQPDLWSTGDRDRCLCAFGLCIQNLPKWLHDSRQIVGTDSRAGILDANF